MSTMASQITSLTIAYSSVDSSANQREHQSSASLAFVRGIHRPLVISPHKGPETQKMFPFDDVIMCRMCVKSTDAKIQSISKYISTIHIINICIQTNNQFMHTRTTNSLPWIRLSEIELCILCAVICCQIQIPKWHYNDAIWASSRPKSRATRLLIQQFVQFNNNENTKTPHYMPYPGDRWFTLKDVSNAESVSMSWRHQEAICLP